ncbi:PREDICTED: zinc finger and BTB domain-containing protein 38 [Rhagoletis zephyria]|uniref:zinc finger and BTB domain-containing protein 38 n=1 Tax=Rhagoletis zephyria TaxID=28612 RepID=UPI000811835E|nr:PREDICTED: zinc finger and BTB domain-containing protein 38 [Rhagoletis zephyria]
MAAETVQIKQEPLEIIYAAEMGEFDADAATIGSSRSNEGFAVGVGRGACYDFGSTADAATKFPSNVTIKVEPNFYTYAENYNNGYDFNTQKMVVGSANMDEDVQIKAEPEDDFAYAPADSFNICEQLSETTKPQEPSNYIGADFQVVQEHENMITVSASDSIEQNHELAFLQKLQANYQADYIAKRNRRTRKSIICKLCMKRSFQDTHYAHHMAQHKLNRMFCVRKTCDTWFGSLEDCEQHEFDQHDIRQLKCNVCNHKFHDFYQLNQHKVKMHSKLHRFVCSLCREWFINMAELQEHWTSLPDECGRLACIQRETPAKILQLLKEKQKVTKHNSYKIKCASKTAPPGLKLRLKPILPNNNINTPHIPTQKTLQTIEIKQEPVDYETILPDFPIVANNTKPLENYEVVQPTPTLSKNDLAAPPVKLRLRKQPLSVLPVESEPATLAPAKQTGPGTLGHALAQRITSKFSLKSVPKMFQIINKVSEFNSHTTTPETSPQSPSKVNINTTNSETVPIKFDSPPKMIKLPSNFKIVKMMPTTQLRLIQLVKSNSPPKTAAIAEEAIPKFETPNRYFQKKEVEVPSLDKTVAAAKLESVTKTNKELSLTELLNEAIVREEINTSEPIDSKLEEAVVQEPAKMEIIEIKKELDEEMLVLQNENSVYAANFSDNSMGSNSTATMQNTNSEDGSGELRKRPHSPHITRNNARSKPKKVPEGYICPKCGRRYSTQSMVKEHLSNNCGRNPQHQCDICQKCFFSNSTLNCHRTIHTGVLPHKCNYCEKRFRTRGQVTVHHRTHTGERPFVCEICSQSFTHRETLISHLSRHIGMKRYKCYGCNKQFSCISGLSMHRSTRPATCGQFELNSRAIGPRVRVIRGRVVFEPQPVDGDDDEEVKDVSGVNIAGEAPITEVLTEIQNTAGEAPITQILTEIQGTGGEAHITEVLTEIQNK